MTASISSRFYRAAVVYGLIGMALGIFMAASHNHDQMPTHAHLLLIGWVSMFLFGAFYQFHAAVSARLAVIHWWIANAGVVILTTGLFIIYGGNPAGGEPLATAGSLFTIAGMALFAYNVFQATSTKAAQAAASGSAA